MLIFFNKAIKSLVIILFVSSLLVSCQSGPSKKDETINQATIAGSWKLLTGTVIEGEDTTITDYTMNQELIKIINDSHFAFLRHDLGLDSSKVFVSGGGRCKTQGNTYIEHLDFCNYREWENNKFEFTFEISEDTLTTTGREHIESLNIDRLNIEQYIRINTQKEN